MSDDDSRQDRLILSLATSQTIRPGCGMVHANDISITDTDLGNPSAKKAVWLPDRSGHRWERQTVKPNEKERD